MMVSAKTELLGWIVLTASGPTKEVIEDKTVTVANADFAGAVGENKPNPWGKGHLQLYAFSLLVYLVSTMNGASGSLL